MLKQSVTFVLVVGLAALPGCKKKEADKAGADKAGAAGDQGAAKPADKPAEAPAAGPLTLDKVGGLKIDAPAGSKVDDGVVGGQMVQGPDLVVSIDVASPSSPATLADQKTDSEMYSPLNWKEETLPDGWAVTFENKGGMGTNYWAIVRRDIGGKAYRCETTASSATQQANAVAACKSLKP